MIDMYDKIQKNKRINTGKVSDRSVILLLILMISITITGCSKNQESSDNTAGETKIVLTTGFEKEEVFRISKISCTVSEVMVYMTNMQNQYESVYGSRIWDIDTGDGTTLEDKVKDTVIARIAQIKTMNLLAAEYETVLTDAEEKRVALAANTYFDSLNDKEKSTLSVDYECIEQLYREYAIANKIYYNIIQDVNPEISDDEARTITVKVIFLKTYSMNGDEKVPYDDVKISNVFKKAQEICKKAQNGEDFDALISEYSEDKNSTYSFGKGEMAKNFEDAAFNLNTDAVSNVVETENGCYIIKCVSTFNRKETDVNKEKITEQRKREAFDQVYDDYVKTQVRNLNNQLWDEIKFIHDPDVRTQSFFQTYDDTFEGWF